MRKHPFVAFLLTVAVLVMGAISFIQSETFARVLKQVAVRRLPSDLGIEADFSDLSVGLFPPSVSIRNPKVSLDHGNLINLPPGSSVTAKRIDLRFRFFQMFSGNIRIHEAVVVDGTVNLVLRGSGETKSAPKPVLRPQIHWDELFQIRAEAIGLENTKIHIDLADIPFSADFTAERLKLAQWSGSGGLGYELRSDLKDITAESLKEWLPPAGIERLSIVAHVNASGAEVDDLSTFMSGSDIHLSGTIRGNILAAKELPFESHASVRADLAALAQFLPERFKSHVIQGNAELDAKIKGNLLAVKQTAKIEGQATLDGVQYDAWVAEHVSLDAAYDAGAGSPSITLSRAKISAPEIAREGGHRPASGGEIEIGQAHYVFGASEPVSVPLKFTHAHLHWLGAGVVKALYPLDARLDGTAVVAFTPAQSKAPWSAEAELHLSVPQFQLDNQRLGKEKPLTRVLIFKDLKLDGPVSVDAQGVSIDGLVLSLPHTKLTVNGSVSGASGYDLTGEGQASLADIGEIAQNGIAGDGDLKIHVHGPSSRVFIDFDADLKDAYYLRLKFGDFKGRITWDDDPDVLIFDHVNAVKGQTPYVVDGQVDCKNDTVGLRADFPGGNIADMTKIFENFTEDLWWFPRSVSGSVKGAVKVSGGTALNQLVVAADLTGSNWEYLRERFRSVNLKGGYDKGKYQVTDFHGIKQSGRFSGKISYDAEKRIDWDFKTQDLQMTDLDHLARLDVPFRGEFRFETHGNNAGGTLDSLTEGSVSELSVRGQSYQPSQFQIRTENGFASGSGEALGGQATADFRYGLNPGAPSMVQVALKHFDFAPGILLLNPKLMRDPKFQAFASGAVKLAFRSGEVERGSGELSVSEYHLEKSGTSFTLSHPVSTKIVDGDFALNELAIAGPAGTARLDLKGKPSALDGSVSGDLDLSIAEFATSVVGRAEGLASLDFAIGGILKAPTVYGSAELHDASLRIPAVDSPFENLTGSFQLKQNVLTVDNIQSDLGGGRVTLNGTIKIFPDQYPALALKGDLTNTRVRIYPFQFVRFRGSIGVNGEERPYLVDGAVTIDSALSKEKILGRSSQEEGPKSLQYTPVGKGQGDYDVPLFRLKIDATAEHGVLVQNDLFDAELKAKVTVVNTLESPSLLGTADLVQGKMTFKSRVFQIQSANAVFDNPTVINPHFNLTASTDVSGTKVQLYASGPISKPKLDFTSNPAMSESEILSLLALGNVPTNSGRISSLTVTDRTAAQQGEAASLILQTMDFNREVEEKTGFEFQIDEYENNLQGYSIFSRTSNETTVSPKIIVKRNIGDRVTISYGSTVGVDSNKQSEANVELHVTPGFSLIGVWDSYEFDDLAEKLDSQTSYGFDLKLQKRFR